nr:cell fusion protein cfr1 [Quercus suber]
MCIDRELFQAGSKAGRSAHVSIRTDAGIVAGNTWRHPDQDSKSSSLLSTMLVSLTVGKVDAGVAVLLTEDKRLIEFPSILLPPDIHSGSIVDINVSHNSQAELVADQTFATLQNEIFNTFGNASPTAPVLRCRNATQTSVVLEWDPINLATAELRSLSLYRNGTKAGVIPRDKLSTKISGLALDTEYIFHLVLRTSAGQYSSEKLAVRTHKMTDLTGITITPGIMPSPLKDSLAETVQKIGAKMIDTVRIDTTHFVCTERRGQAWEKAVELNVPVVVPDWLKGCEREGRLVGVRAYYLDANPKDRQMGPSSVQQRIDTQGSSQSRESPRIEHTPPTPDTATHESSLSATNVATTQSRDGQSINGSGANAIVGSSLAERPKAAQVAKDENEDEEEEDEEIDEEASTNEAHGAESSIPDLTTSRKVPEDSSEAAGEDGKFDETYLIVRQFPSLILHRNLFTLSRVAENDTSARSQYSVKDAQSALPIRSATAAEWERLPSGTFILRFPTSCLRTTFSWSQHASQSASYLRGPSL